MTDPFALLGVPRRLSLDEETLKSRFHALTAQHHPDVSPEGGDTFQALNLAYQTLREPRTRLRAWLEQVDPALLATRNATPPAITALFSGMGHLKQKLDAFLKKREAASSALAKALLLDEQYSLQEELEQWLANLDTEKNSALARLPELDTASDTTDETARTRCVTEVALISQSLGYLDRWIAQIREGLVRLQLG